MAQVLLCLRFVSLLILKLAVSLVRALASALALALDSSTHAH